MSSCVFILAQKNVWEKCNTFLYSYFFHFTIDFSLDGWQQDVHLCQYTCVFYMTPPLLPINQMFQSPSSAFMLYIQKIPISFSTISFLQISLQAFASVETCFTLTLPILKDLVLFSPYLVCFVSLTLYLLNKIAGCLG